MFKPYTVADSLWQMNFFMALQVSRLSALAYLTDPPAGTEPEELTDEAEEAAPAVSPRHRNAA